MPIVNSLPKKEKRDYKQELLDRIAQRSGLGTALLMEKGLKLRDKQLENLMLGQGMTLEQIASSKGVDMADMNKKLAQDFQAEMEKPKEKKEEDSGNPQAVQALGSLIGGKGQGMAQPTGGKQAPTHAFQFPTSTQDAGWGIQLLSLLAGQGLPNTRSGGAQQGSKGVYGFDPTTGKVSLQGEVPANADVRNMQPSNDLTTLPTELQPAAYALARKIAGVRGAEKALPGIINNLKAGKSIDQIEDEIRLKGQSPEFSTSVRDAAQNIAIEKTESQRNVAFDALDDYVQRGDMGGAKDYLKRMSVTSATADQRTRIMGKERTVQLLGEIQGDLDTLEANGIKTGFFSGNYENLLARVGQVQNPEMRKIATKVATAMMNYRRDMTGVQFGEREGREYKTVFPNINKIGAFNKASIDGLKETFSGDVEKFYSQSMGERNYNKIFKQTEESDMTTEDFSKMSDEELRAIAEGGQ